MRLKRVLVSLLLILTMTTQVFAASIPVEKLEFPDIKGHWAEKYINDFKNNGIIKGYPDGTFRPDINISRAEFASLLFYLLKLNKTDNNDSNTKDFEGSWAEDYLESLVEKDIIDLNEYAEGYDYDGAITRIEITKMILRSLGKDSIARNIKSKPGFKDDVLLKASDYGYVYLAKYYDIVTGYEDGTYRPDNHATRAETVKMLVSRGNASAKIADENKPSSSAPRAVIDFKLPEYTHTDKAVNFDFTSRNARSLNWSLKKASAANEMTDVELNEYASLAVEDKSGKIQFQDKGLYSLVASARNVDNRLAVASSDIKVYPVMDIQFGLLETAYTDTEVKVDVSALEVGEHEIEWSLEKDGEQVSLNEMIEGTLNNDGGTIRFTQRGNYTLIASVTDEVGRTFEHRDSIKIYHLISTEFILPETAHTDDFIDVSVIETGLESYTIEWILGKDNQEVELKDHVDGILSNDGGRIRFMDKGTYSLTAKVTDETGRIFTKKDEIKVFPLVEASFTLPEAVHTDKEVNVVPNVKELGDLEIKWSLLQNGEEVAFQDYIDGTLSNDGGKITFKQKGDYTLKAIVTDELGRNFKFEDQIKVYPVVEISFDMPPAVHTDESAEIKVSERELGHLNIEWTLKKNGEVISIKENVNGVLENKGGTITIPSKGNYELTAAVTDEMGREYTYSKKIDVYPLVAVNLNMPKVTHADESFTVGVTTEELGALDIIWLLYKDGQEVNLEEYVIGALDNDGGTITVNAKGTFELKAEVTDELGRVYSRKETIQVYPVVEVNVSAPENGHTDGEFDVTVTTMELGSLHVDWSLIMDDENVSFNDFVSGTLSDSGGKISIPQKGAYTLIAKITDELGREYTDSVNIKVYPVMSIYFDLPEYGHTDTLINVNVEAKELEGTNITWQLEKDGKPVTLAAYTEGTLSNNGGAIKLTSRGNYRLLASASNNISRVFSFSDTIKTYPVADFVITMPTTSRIGEAIPLEITQKDTEDMNIAWKLKKDNVYVKLSDYFVGELQSGKSISFNASGQYTLEAVLTDQTGRTFTQSSTIEIINSNPLKPTISASVTRQIKDGKFLVNLNVQATDPDGDSITYEYEGKASDNYYLPGAYTVKVRAKDQFGAYSEWASAQFTVVNRAPTPPVMVRTPNTNSVAPGTNVKITASSTDQDGDAITYIWEGRPAETAKYPLGKNVVKVKAVDAAGAESPWAAIVFFVADAENGGGMTLTSRDSTIIEQGILGATITEYTFNVPAVSGHSGNDYGRVRGYNIQTNQWDQLDYKTTKNGVNMAKTLPTGKYSKLEFYYYTNHNCMYNKSNITYTVKYHFE
ncbi:S-layer homology domain-containing protein [Anaerosolibacter sp.]|uniref:S-layer homology domain-containing protein n=1 Tax=Anaerosolibacter sp. TaxID=1872527 RepID=UPI0039EFED80